MRGDKRDPLVDYHRADSVLTDDAGLYDRIMHKSFFKRLKTFFQNVKRYLW